MKIPPLLFVPIIMAGCTYVRVKPNTLDRSEVIYVERGGHQMLMATKDILESRGYNVTVGEKRATVGPTFIESKNPDSIMARASDNHARYVVDVNERRDFWLAFPCLFHGMWWWSYDLSVSDNKTGDEILNMTTRGCAAWTEGRFKKYLNQIEIAE